MNCKKHDNFMSIVLAGFMAATPVAAVDTWDPSKVDPCLNEFLAKNAEVESAGSGGYAAIHNSSKSLDTTNGRAIGAYGIMMGNWVNKGYVTFPAGVDRTWNNAQFSQEAQGAPYYVKNVQDLLYTDGGALLQDQVARLMLADGWATMDATERSMIGQTFPVGDGTSVTMNAAMMQRGSWFMGDPAFSKWAATGFTADGLRSIDKSGAIYRNNCAPNSKCNSYEDLARHTLGKMAKFKDIDVSGCFDGAAYAQGGVTCDPKIANYLAEVGKKKVSDTVVAAQDQTLGISKTEKAYDKMSCVDFAFKGSFQNLFNVPSFDQIAGLVEGIGGKIGNVLENGISIDEDAIGQLACQAVNNMTGQAMNKVTGALGDLSINESIGFGPIGDIASVNLGFNPNATGGGIQTQMNVNSLNLNNVFGDFGSVAGIGVGDLGSVVKVNEGTQSNINIPYGELRPYGQKIDSTIKKTYSSLFGG